MLAWNIPVLCEYPHRTSGESRSRFALFGVAFRSKQLPPRHMCVGISGNLQIRSFAVSLEHTWTV